VLPLKKPKFHGVAGAPHVFVNKGIEVAVGGTGVLVGLGVEVGFGVAVGLGVDERACFL
jgi:hypothetical protein